MNKTLLETSNIHISYDAGRSYVLRDISFSLCAGEILSIIGKNGAGKSSLLKAIIGIQKPFSGEIKKHTARIAYVPQKLDIADGFPLKVSEFFEIFNTQLPKEKYTYLNKTLEIDALLDKNIHTLSGGELQRVLIANALLSDPELLLLDEPTSSIDQAGEQEFYESITAIQKHFSELGIILVSHNLNLVYKHSSHVICLHDKQLCCHGTPSEVEKNTDIHKIFGEHLRPYTHQPHAKHHHITS